MQRFAVMLAASALLALGAKSASASVIWRGTFEGGDFSNWTKVEAKAPDRLQVVPDPANPSRQVLKVKVIQGDDPIKASGNRNELVYTGDMPNEGEERFYQWSTLWPENYESADTWQLFTQWHHTGLNGSPPVEFYAIGEQIYLRCSGNIVWSAPLERGKWQDFTLHIKWATDASEGFVELFQNGQVTMPKTFVKTMYPGEGVYLKQGLYRNAKIAQEQTLYHSGVTIATAASDLSAEYAENSQSSNSWSEASRMQAQGGAGCDSAGPGVTWPALGAGLLLLALRYRRLKPVRVKARR